MNQTSGLGVRRKTLDMAYIALFVVLFTVCSWISIPLTVPFTLQTFGIFCAFPLIGGKRGAVAILVYLMLGAVGFPVFAGFSGGLGAIMGATGGYLLGFLVSALIYWLMTKIWGEGLFIQALAMILGLLALYTFGTAWFMVVYARSTGPMGLTAALGFCVVPFILPDLCKLALALMVSRRVKRFIR